MLTLQSDEKIEPPQADGDEEKGDLEKENRTVDDNVPSQNATMSACLRTFQAAQAEMSQLINLIDLSRGDQFVSVERVTKTLPLSVSNNSSILCLVVAIGCIMQHPNIHHALSYLYVSARCHLLQSRNCHSSVLGT